MNRIAIAVLALLAVVVVCGCSSIPPTKPTCIDAPAGAEKWEVIRQYVRDNYGPLAEADRDNYVISEWVLAGRDENTEYRKKIGIWPYYTGRSIDFVESHLQISVVVEKRDLDSSVIDWRECGYDEAEQDKIAQELRSILN